MRAELKPAQTFLIRLECRKNVFDEQSQACGGYAQSRSLYIIVVNQMIQAKKYKYNAYLKLNSWCNFPIFRDYTHIYVSAFNQTLKQTAWTIETNMNQKTYDSFSVV